MDNDAMTAAVAEEIAAVMTRIREAPDRETAIERELARLIVSRAQLRAELNDARDTLIERWHKSGSDLSAHAWMGMTRERYAAWVEGKE